MSELFIQTRGHGPRHVVLLHGWAMHGGIFAPLVERLARTATVHVVDLPGHGRSRDSHLSLEPAVCARAIAEATPPATWLGWSLGGVVAMTGALDMPDKVKGLAVISSSPCFLNQPGWTYGRPLKVFEDFGRELGRDYTTTLERFLALEAMGSSRARSDMEALHEAVFALGEPDPRVLVEGLDIIRHTDLRARLADLAQPSVWIAGSRDRLIPWQAMAWAADAAHGQFVRVEHAGHAAFIGFTGHVLDALSPLLAGAAAAPANASTDTRNSA